ncbi:DNA-3-methyladenine glycosylase 2 family protein, partial [Escherichia coli]|nr:DNA-3-methyladenine glycosylase 2 family protein [Escherichia coli]
MTIAADLSESAYRQAETFLATL